MRIPKSLAGLLVGAAMSFLAPAARAEFSMQIKNNGSGDGFKIDETSTGFQLSALGTLKPSDVTWSADAGTIHAVATIDGYTFNVTGRSNQDATPTPAMGGVSLDALVTAGSNVSKTSFSFYVADDPATFPGTSGKPILLQAATFTGGQFAPGDSVKAASQLVSYDGTGTTGQSLTNWAGPVKGANQTAVSNTVVVPSRGVQYALADVGGLALSGNPGTTMRFWTQSVTAMPEPTGIVIGLLGAPFVGGLILLARRRSAKAPVLA